jgi:hypothetical protein
LNNLNMLLNIAFVIFDFFYWLLIYYGWLLWNKSWGSYRYEATQRYDVANNLFFKVE